MKKILDVTMPDIDSYPIYANPYAIMQSYSETREWLLSNCIQLCSNTKVLCFYDFNYKTCPLLDVQRILTAQLETIGIDWIPFIIQCLRDNRYVYLIVKKKHIGAYYLNDTFSRESDESVHDILIYGYDLKQERFYIADNFYGGKYAFSQCSFSDMKKAINDVSPREAVKTRFKGSIELITYIGESPDLSVRRIYEALGDYYYCRPTGMWNIMEVRNYNRNREWLFGLDCYEYMINQVANSNLRNMQIQDFHLMWEHKKHLKRIIEYLLEQEYIADDSYVTRIDNVICAALRTRNMVLKTYMSGKPADSKRIISICKQMREEESELISHLLEQLKICDMERLMYQK